MSAFTKALVLFGTFGITYLIAVAVLDPLTSVVLGYQLGGMSSTVQSIHEAGVKYMVPVFIGTVLSWVVFYILRNERQTMLQ